MSRLPSIILQLKREFKRLNDELSIQEMALKNVVDEETQTFNEIESRELTLTELLKELKVKQNINDELLQKHNAVQDKLKTLNEERKKDSKSVKDEKKTFLGDLGIRVCIKELTLPVWQIMINYDEHVDSLIVLDFDNLTDSYTLVSMYPTPIKINEIAEFLKSTNDISGFLYYCRKFILQTLDEKYMHQRPQRFH